MVLSKSDAPLVVIGAGAAGIACALAAARHGVRVVLVENTSQLGGTISQALIHTIAGLFDDQGNILNQGLPADLINRLTQACPYTQKRRIGKTWVLNVDPSIYTAVVTDWITTMPSITPIFEATIDDMLMDNNSVKQVTVNHHGKTLTIDSKAVVDTSGSAAFIRQVDPALVTDGNALGGYVLQLNGVEVDALIFPKSIALLREIRKAVEQKLLPPECATIWLDNGVFPNEVYAKFNIVSTAFQAEHMKGVATQLVVFLRTIPGFNEVTISAYGQLGIRDGGRIQGEYCLTAADITSGRQFNDAACNASWPIEHWDPSKGITLEYLPPEQSYSIPLRSLKVAGFNNLWAAGKCLSAEARAQASARVAGTCWAMGEAVGKHISRSSTCH